jgi:hypothetical protein
VLLRQATVLESLLRAALGLAWLDLPLVLGLAAAGRALRHRSKADRISTLLVAGWAQILLSFELLGTARLLSFWSLGTLQWLLLGAWLVASRRATRAESTHAGAWVPRSASGHQQDGSRESGVGSRGAPTKWVCSSGIGSRESGIGREAQAPADRLTSSHSASPAWVALVLLGLGLSLGPWLRQLPQPPALEDTLTYHLSFPAEWLQSGELRMPVQHDADLGPTFYPFAGEALQGWWMLSFGADPFATASAWLCLPAMLAALMAIAEALGVGPRAGAASWALLATSPLVLWLTLVGFNDLPLCCALLLSLKACLHLDRDPRPGRAAEAGASLGLAAAVKYSGLALGSGVALLATAAVLRAWRREGSRRAIGMAAAVMAAAALTGGYAYGRNLLLTGSPLYPAHLEILGVRLFTGLYSTAEWTGHAHHLFDWRRHLLTAEGIARSGWPLIAGLLPLGAAALPLAFRRRDFAALLTAASGWVGLVAFWSSSPYRHDPRFYVPGLGLLAAGAILPLEAAGRWLGRLFEPLLALGLCVIYAASGFGLSRWPEQAAAIGAALAWLALRPRPRWIAPALASTLALATAAIQPHYLEQRYRQWEEIYEKQRGKVWSELDRLSPPQGVTVAASGTSNTYPLYGSDLRNRVLFVPLNQNTDSSVYGFGHPFRSVYESPSEERWLENLTRLGVELFVLGPARCEERVWIEGHPERFELLLQAGGYRLYRVRRDERHG